MCGGPGYFVLASAASLSLKCALVNSTIEVSSRNSVTPPRMSPVSAALKSVFFFVAILYAPGALVTLALVTVSFWLIFGTTSPPSITFPKTVCTPFRCLVFCSLSTMKN